MCIGSKLAINVAVRSAVVALGQTVRGSTPLHGSLPVLYCTRRNSVATLSVGVDRTASVQKQRLRSVSAAQFVRQDERGLCTPVPSLLLLKS